jgi:hypothetical protein
LGWRVNAEHVAEHVAEHSMNSCFMQDDEMFEPVA